MSSHEISGIEVLPQWTQDAIPDSCKSCPDILNLVYNLAFHPDAISDAQRIGISLTREKFLETHLTDKIQKYCDGTTSDECKFDLVAMAQSTT